MPNQRSKDKKVVSLPVSKDLLAAIEDEAKKQGVDRSKLINALLKKALKLSPIIVAILWFQFPKTRPALRTCGDAIVALVESGISAATKALAKL